MTSKSNGYEMPSPSNDEQGANMTIDPSDSRLTPKRIVPPSDKEHDASKDPSKPSQVTSCATSPGHPSPSTTVALASTLTVSRYLSTAVNNPFLPPEAENLSTSSSQHSLNSIPPSASSLVNENLISSSSPRSQSPEIWPNISPATSLNLEKDIPPGADVEMLPFPIISATRALDTQSVLSDVLLSDSGTFLSSYEIDAKSSSKQDALRRIGFNQEHHSTIDMQCAKKKEQAFNITVQDPNKSETERKLIDRLRIDNKKQESSSNEKEDLSENLSVFDGSGATFTVQRESVAGGASDNDSTMKNSETVATLPSSTSYSSVRERAAEILISRRRMRGLQNNGNTCFINVILQSLLSCDPFRKLALGGEAREGMLLEKFGHVAWEMTEEASSPSIHGDFSSDASLLPKWFFGILKPTEAIADSYNGTQEDAEEFLSIMLNKLQDEEVARREGRAPGEKSDTCSGGWQSGVQGQRFVDTNISKIFGGSSVSEVRRTSQKPSLTEVSFFSLSLDVDVDSVNSIPEALNNYFATEIISDEVGKDGKEMRIEKQLFLTETPQVLILHLKRFACDKITFAPKKVMKEIKYHDVLDLPDAIMRDKENPYKMSKKYELMAVVTHLGLTPAGGHYYCDVRFRKRDGTSIWVKCDDEILKEIEVDEVLRRDAYVLFYCAF